MKFSKPTLALHGSLCLALGAAATVGCAEFDGEPATSSVTEAVQGGNIVLGNSFTGVARLIISPPDDKDGPVDPFECSGAAIAPNLVLTSARCVEDNVDETTFAFLGSINVGFGNDGGEPAGGIEANHVELHRYYDRNNAGASQLAIIRLPTDVPASVTPVTVNENSPMIDGFTGMVTIAGYGEDGNTGAGVRRAAETSLPSAPSKEFFQLGDATIAACDGDGGAPVFANLGAGDVLIGVVQFTSSCQLNHPVTRVDRHTVEFIIPYIDQFNGPCLVDATCTTVGCRTPDPDCPENGCEWGNTCVETDSTGASCPSRDWDCTDRGSFGGEECTSNAACEELGMCIPTVDDADFLYCAVECEETSDCPLNTTCENSQCVYGNPSPGSQGFDCAQNDECRSGICEDRICVNTCDVAANDCPGDFNCGPSKVQPGTNVCLGLDLSGGGGFCSAGGNSGSGLLVLLALGLIAVGRRRRED